MIKFNHKWRDTMKDLNEFDNEYDKPYLKSDYTKSYKMTKAEGFKNKVLCVVLSFIMAFGGVALAGCEDTPDPDVTPPSIVTPVDPTPTDPTPADPTPADPTPSDPRQVRTRREQSIIKSFRIV